MLLFKKQWELHPSLVDNVLSGCLATIRAERTGQLIDRQLVRRLLSMLASLGCFTSLFKPLLVADLERFFAEESARMLSDSDVSVFLLYCERRLKEESDNLGAIMPASDCNDMLRTVRAPLPPMCFCNIFARYSACCWSATSMLYYPVVWRLLSTLPVSKVSPRHQPATAVFNSRTAFLL